MQFSAGERMKGYKFAGDNTLPLDVQARMMKILAQVAAYVAEHGLKRNAEE